MVRVYEQTLPARRWTERRRLSNVWRGPTKAWKERLDPTTQSGIQAVLVSPRDRLSLEKLWDRLDDPDEIVVAPLISQ